MGEQHPHSIVLIKDQFKKNSNRYLVYDDPRWGCKLFLNYHSMPNVNDDIKNIRTRLSQELKLDESNIQGAFLFEKIHEKYSPTANSIKEYKHDFYCYSLNDIPKKLQKDEFEIEGKKYSWMSIAEMENDKDIMTLNSDIVKFVKETSV